MNFAFLLALLTLTLTDPTGDAIGDGTLDPPTSPVYANVAMFDLQGVDLEVSESGDAVLSVTLGALGASVAGAGEEAEGDELPAGDEEPTDSDVVDEELRREEAGQFDVSGMLAVVDVYLDVGVGGADQTLSGPNMLLPTGSGWHHAVRISAEGAWGVTYVGASQVESLEPGSGVAGVGDGAGGTGDLDGQDGGAAEPGEASEPTSSEPQTLNYVPLTIVRNGNVLSMTLPWEFDPEAATDIFAMTGIHDPFSPDGWRPISQSSSPWAFSGGQQVVPVIDLLAPDSEAQVAALRTGVLPAPDRESGLELPLSPWLWLMVAGLGLAVFGLILRGRVGAPGTAPGAAKSGVEEPTEDGPADDESADADAAEADLPYVNIAGAGFTGADLGATDLSEEDEVASDAHEVDVVSTLLPLEPEPEPTEPSAESYAPDALLLTDTVDEAPKDVVEREAGSTGGASVQPNAETADAGVILAGPAEVAESNRPGFSTAVDESYLTVGDSDEDGLFGDDSADGESFWHPGSRGKKTLVESEPVESEPVESKPVESQPVEGNLVESEPVESQPVDSQAADKEPLGAEPVENPSDE